VLVVEGRGEEMVAFHAWVDTIVKGGVSGVEMFVRCDADVVSMLVCVRR